MALPPVLILLSCFCLLATTTLATHFRYGTMSWAAVPNRTNTIGLTIQIAYRSNVYRNMDEEGSSFRPIFERLTLAKGTLRSQRLKQMTISSGGIFDEWIASHGYIEYTYPDSFVSSNADWTIELAGCCRVGTLRHNAHRRYSVSTVVNRDAFIAGLSGPSVNMFPILEVTRGQNSQLLLSAFSEVDGVLASGAMTVSWVDSYHGASAIDDTTGLSTWDTRNLNCGEKSTPRCKVGRRYTGRRLAFIGNVPTLLWCQNLCDQKKKCKFLRYQASTKKCHLMKKKGWPRKRSGWTSCRMSPRFDKPCLYPMQAIVVVSCFFFFFRLLLFLLVVVVVMLLLLLLLLLLVDIAGVCSSSLL